MNTSSTSVTEAHRYNRLTLGRVGIVHPPFSLPKSADRAPCESRCGARPVNGWGGRSGKTAAPPYVSGVSLHPDDFLCRIPRL